MVRTRLKKKKAHPRGLKPLPRRKRLRPQHSLLQRLLNRPLRAAAAVRRRRRRGSMPDGTGQPGGVPSMRLDGAPARRGATDRPRRRLPARTVRAAATRRLRRTQGRRRRDAPERALHKVTAKPHKVMVRRAVTGRARRAVVAKQPLPRPPGRPLRRLLHNPLPRVPADQPGPGQPRRLRSPRDARSVMTVTESCAQRPAMRFTADRTARSVRCIHAIWRFVTDSQASGRCGSYAPTVR